MKSIKAQGMPINVIVMLIIGLVIFGLGMGLFSKISSSGEEEIGRLNDQVKTGIQSLECDGADWICSPAYELTNGDGATYNLFIANKGDENQKFKIEFIDAESGEGEIYKDGCGFVILNYLSTLEVNVLSGESAQIPFIVKAKNVEKTPCSFIATVKLLDEMDDEIDRTSVIIKVK